MSIYVVWSGDVLIGEYEAMCEEHAIDQAVDDGGGTEIEYDAMYIGEKES